MDSEVNLRDQKWYFAKENLLQAGLFPGCVKECYCCAVQPNDCGLLKEGVQCLMDEHVILIEKVLSTKNLCRDLSVISGTPFKITSKGHVRITANPKSAPLIITKPGPIPYSSEKAIPQNYGQDVYYHGVKQDLSDEDDEEVDPNIDNIAGTNKITISRRILSPVISPPIQVTVTKTTAEP